MQLLPSGVADRARKGALLLHMHRDALKVEGVGALRRENGRALSRLDVLQAYSTPILQKKKKEEGKKPLLVNEVKI